MRRRPTESRIASFPEGSIGTLMEPPLAVFVREQTVGDAIDAIRELVKSQLVTYAWVLEADGTLVGVITMRDLLFNERSAKLGDVMLKSVFALRTTMPLLDAMKLTLDKHYPVYPVVDTEGHLQGMVRGPRMFEAQAVELSAQAGEMVGVDKEERLATPWPRSLLFRHPWLQLNLLTAFVAAAVVGFFEPTLEKIVILAVFLPVLAGQSGNTGCQALAVTLRGMTLGELKPSGTIRALSKEAILGFLNGVLVGITAGGGMYFYAWMQGNAQAWMLAVTTLVAMVIACTTAACPAFWCPRRSSDSAPIPQRRRRFSSRPPPTSSAWARSSASRRSC